MKEDLANRRKTDLTEMATLRAMVLEHQREKAFLQ
jgi:hypothetical protein